MKVVLTSEIKNPFTLLSHPFGGWPREKQLSDWQWRRETERQREGFNKGGSLERNRKVEWAPLSQSIFHHWPLSYVTYKIEMNASCTAWPL